MIPLAVICACVCVCVHSIKGAKGNTHSWRSHIYRLPVWFLPFVSSMRRHLRFHSLCVLLPVLLLLLFLLLLLLLLVILVPHALLVVVVLQAAPLPACLLRNCWKMASQFRLGLISTIALASLPSPPSLCLLSLLSFFEFAFWFSFCLQSREIKLFCPFSAFSCCHIGFYLSYCHGLLFLLCFSFCFQWKTLQFTNEIFLLSLNISSHAQRHPLIRSS